jgi:hypothetical protein
MQQKSIRDIVGGCAIILLGLFFLVGATDYGFGTPTRMGPGFFPGTLGALAILIGIAIAIKGLRSGDGEIPKIHYRSVAAVVVGVSTFALLIERAGIIPAAFLAIIILSLGNKNPGRPVIVLTLAASVAIIGWLVFVVGFGLPLTGIKGVL